MSAKEKLLPCPFCGIGKSIVSCVFSEYNKWFIGCGSCGTSGGMYHSQDKQKAIDAWNKRSPDYDELKAWLNDEKLYRIVDKLEELQAREEKQ